ncbi:MAG TPA: SAM-dependent methyltransferase [Leucothrix mucor]|nr:SAM-dependent methyltransferase [Leucothrix mucor]
MEKTDSVFNSRSIVSSQSGLHENLEKTVKKHLDHPYKKPIAQHTQDAFDQIKQKVESSLAQNVPLIFDSCCGTALSTKILATENPNALVLGIDRSSFRLSKEYNEALPDNAVLIQADCADFWVLAKNAGWKLKKHTIFYPNPYPKTKHLKRRWHAHPVFPTLLALGGELELRTNWKIYADEFCAALNFADQVCDGVNNISPDQVMTLFEKKYHESGQELYQCRTLILR